MSTLYTPTADEVKQRLRPFGLFFEKSLKDLIKGIRSHTDTPEQLHEFLINVLSECREEVKSSDFNSKTNAILKLTYLEMYGFDMAWANFHVLEVMSSNKIQQKRVGYLAASQSFHKDSDILMLATNLLKKDLKYSAKNDTVRMGIALSGLSTIVTPELARDICDDLLLMLNSAKPYIRKKAVTALFKVFLQYPEALRDNFDKFVGRLEDDDLSVVSATVSIICELSKHNPHPFIQLSPLLYQMLIKVDNNWVIIRLLKLFTNLSQVETKLRIKLLPNVLELMDSTSAISVVYESINCIIRGNMLEPDDYDTAVACLDKLHDFCSSTDPNLRYISCVLFYKIGKINPDFISNFDNLILRLLKDVDVSIRSKALELLEGVINEDNSIDAVKSLLKQLVDVDTINIDNQEFSIDIPDSYKCKMVHTICKITSMNNYVNIGDFEWYLALLSDLCVVSQDLPDKSLGNKVGEQVRNVMIKVPELRDKTIVMIAKLITTDTINKQLPGVLKECIWCLGEYSYLLENKEEIISFFVKNAKSYEPEVQQIMIPAMLKIYSNWCNGAVSIPIATVKQVTSEMVVLMESFVTSKNFEVQERASETLEFLRLCLESLSEDDSEELPLLITEVLASFFNGFELQPIIAGTQRKLQYSAKIDLDTPFLTEKELEEMITKEESFDGIQSPYDSESEDKHTPDTFLDEAPYLILSPEEQEALQERRRQERLNNPFYLNDDNNSTKKTYSLISGEEVTPEPAKTMATLTADSEHQLKPKKKKKTKVRVISDAVIVDGISDRAVDDDNSERQSISSSIRNRIALQTKNNLDSFDFSKREYEKRDEYYEPVDLQKLREKFSQQQLVDEYNGSTAEEVVIIKKKKKHSKDKEASSGKKKKKKKPKSQQKSKSAGESTGEEVSPPIVGFQ
ncbi:HER072Cp [Eremothecium sinecaudum]|uniref:AP-3 complex subunit delta n=1 Tax=Eremothecium sinecaudum TaxID=45286 RepID=A0A0X8HTV0_9SACH|nr:HER072Cp [Eremothecium sinecaudum]AMD21351.1 HER072Cp [Eremothecium sinecaudum]